MDAIAEQLLLLLRDEIGSGVELIDCQVGNRHQGYLVILVELRHPSCKMVIKLAGPEAAMACPFDRIAALHCLVARSTTIPMPEIVAMDISYQRWPWRYLIKTHIAGTEWAVARNHMTAEQMFSAYRQLGDAVAQLHGIRFPAFGELSIDAQVQARQPYLGALRERASHFIKTARLRDHFFGVLDRYADLFEDVCQASLCHEDLHGHNILFEIQRGQWKLATILDFDKAWAGHQETDLARLDLWRGMTNEDFWQAYEAIHPIDPLFGQRRLVYQLLWCLEYARPTAKHLADTKQICEKLGAPVVENFD